MPVSIKTLIPKHTILGKAIAGDKTGALASAKNYVKSGEFATDIKNVGMALSTGNVTPVLMKASGINETKKLLDKGGSVTSLKPTPAQTSNANQAQTEANIALAVGSGVPASQANLIGGSTFAMAQNDVGSPSDKPTNTWAYVLGAGVLLLIGSKKKVRTYVRRRATTTYRRARSYGRKTYSRAMSYRTKKRKNGKF